MADELWLKIPGFPDYSVSNCGQIRRDTSKKGAKANRIMSQAIRDDGYRFVSLRDPLCNKINVYVHKAVALAFKGDPPTPKHEVAHWDNNRGNNHVDNLRWATRAENHADKHRHGTARVQAGEANVNAKLTYEIVKVIKEERLKGYTFSQLAKKYGISRSYAWAICAGRSWKKQNAEFELPPKWMVG